MKPLVLDSSSIFLCLKNDRKIFPLKKIHEKGGPALRWAILEPPTLPYTLKFNGNSIQAVLVMCRPLPHLSFSRADKPWPPPSSSTGGTKLTYFENVTATWVAGRQSVAENCARQSHDRDGHRVAGRNRSVPRLVLTSFRYFILAKL